MHQDEKVQNLVKNFLSSKKILIADVSVNESTGLFKVLQDFGAQQKNILSAASFEQAEELVLVEKPPIIFTDYDLGERCGLDLLEKLRKKNGNLEKDSLFVIVTNNTSQMAVGRSVEVDVDAYIIKPYTIEGARDVLQLALTSKVQPSTYIQAIEEGRELIQQESFKEAEQKLTEALKLDASPSLAHYYLGFLKTLTQSKEEAEAEYRKGLGYDPMHYKCLIGLTDLLTAQKRYNEAYVNARTLSNHFPLNPKRLMDLLRLGILSEQYQDIEEYYQAYATMDARDVDLNQHICAALIVCGKHFLSNANSKAQGIDLFRKVMSTGRVKAFHLKEIITALVEFDCLSEARGFLQKFSAEDRKSLDFQVCDVLIREKGKKADL